MIFKFSKEISGAKEGNGDAMPRRSSVGAVVLNASTEKRGSGGGIHDEKRAKWLRMYCVNRGRASRECLSPHLIKIFRFF